MTMTLTELITAVTGLVTTTVPDLAIYIAGAVVVAGGAILFGRMLRAGR
jgi:hypothetical protein